MNSNLPMKRKKSFFEKIISFFRKFFFGEYSENDEIENAKDIAKDIPIEYKKDAKEKFNESIRVEVKNDFIKDIKREEFLDEIERNPNLLYDLPIEKLEKLEEYYKVSINSYEEKLESLRRKN